MTEYEERIKTLTADMEDWVEGRRSWTNILPDTTAAGHAAAAVMDAQEVIKRSTAIQAYVAQCMTLMKLLDAYKERDRLRAALEFYADPDTYKATPSGSQNSWGNYEVIDYPIGDDEGEIARAALEGRE